MGRTYIGRMIRLQISAAVFAAIVATLPGNVNVENARAPTLAAPGRPACLP
jgi:hypothetical protein